VADAGPNREQSASAPSKSIVKATPVSERLAGPRGWLARISGRFAAPSSRRETSGERSPTASPVSQQHDASKYNWSGFSCPYCGASSFVKCSSGHLACDGAAEMRNDRRFHRCFCGHSGYIGGHIQSFNDRRQSFEPAVTPKQSYPISGMTKGQSGAMALPLPQGPPARG
jgi:hypothetical protein